MKKLCLPVLSLFLIICLSPQLLQAQDDDFIRQPPRRVILTKHTRSDLDPQQVQNLWAVWRFFVYDFGKYLSSFFVNHFLNWIRCIFHWWEKITWGFHGLLIANMENQLWNMERHPGNIITRQLEKTHRTSIFSTALGRSTMLPLAHWSLPLFTTTGVEVQSKSSPSRHPHKNFLSNLLWPVSHAFFIS